MKVFAMLMLVSLLILPACGETEQASGAEGDPTAAPTEAAESNRPPIVTEAGKPYVQQARDLLAELDEQVAAADAGEIDATAWGAWSNDWNTRRQAAYEECDAKGNQEVGTFACLPLGDLFNVWSAEDNRLTQGGNQAAVDLARQSLQDDFALLAQ